MKVKMTIEIELTSALDLIDDDEREWAEDEVFTNNGTLIIWSNEIGDEVGRVSKIDEFKWLPLDL